MIKDLLKRLLASCGYEIKRKNTAPAPIHAPFDLLSVVCGGLVIIDDYCCYEGCKKAVDEFIERAGISAPLHSIDSEGRYWIKP